MNKISKIIIIFISNIVFTNYFFIKFESSDYAIAITGLNNFYEDLSDIGMSSSSSIGYLFFAVFISLTTTILFSFFILNRDNFSSPQNFLQLTIYLFLINSGVLLSVLYLLRFFNFPRRFLILDLILYPVFFTVIVGLINIDFGKIFKKNNSNKKYSFVIAISLFLVLSYFFFTQLQESRLEAKVDTADLSNNQNEVQFTITENKIDGEAECYKWSGSDNYSGCIGGLSLSKTATYSDLVTNFVSFKGNFYTIFSNGIIIDSNNDIFLDLRDKVYNEYYESGLFDIVFHPNDNYFLVSYTNLENSLLIEKYSLQDKSSIEIMLEIPNSSANHYCGSMIWSDFYDDFLLCIGDMGNPSNSLNTSIYQGKIILINKTVEKNLELISNSKNDKILENIIAYGLRNPWNFIEYSNLLIVPDVGNKSNEELNIINLEDSDINSQNLFGWPVFEGSIKYEKAFYGLKIWNNDNYSLYDYISENSVAPKIYYDRPAPENNRSAIIGTSIILNSTSVWDKHIIFADSLSKEIFFYDYINDELFISSLPPFPGYITAITTSPFDGDVIIFSTSDDKGTSVYSLTLP